MLVRAVEEEGGGTPLRETRKLLFINNTFRFGN
jgi:hypothetical protein